MRSRSHNRPGVLTAVAAVALATAGCQFTGVNSMPLPIGAGTDADDLRVVVVLNNATNLVPNSEVRYRDVVVGTVRKIRFENWTARLTLGIDSDAHVPADVHARVAQKSLLGAEYLDLQTPERSSAGPLRNDAVIGLDRTGRYPETEEVMGAAALLLNGGGLPQLKTIAHELNTALDGRTGEVRTVVSRLTDLTTVLDDQQEQIVATLDQLNRLSAHVRTDRARLGEALRTLPAGIDVLRRERRKLVAALTAVTSLSTTAHRVVMRTEDGIVRNLHNITPLTRQIAGQADKLANVVSDITFPFPIRAINNGFFGDYINFFANFDLDLAQMAHDWTPDPRVAETVSTLLGVPPTATGSANPLRPPSGADASSGMPSPGAADLDAPRSSEAAPSSASSLGLDALLGALLGGAQ